MKNPFGITTKRCQKKDYDFVYKLLKQTLFHFIAEYFPIDKKMFDDTFANKYKEMTILMKGKRRIGLYSITSLKNTLDIDRLFITPTYQNKGIGKFLMEYFETLGYKKITLQVWDNNPAYHFYKKLGYKVAKKKGHKYIMEKIR
ncbi:GNAT family N-acetyltransferase [Patescibacteria group bacterium]